MPVHLLAGPYLAAAALLLVAGAPKVVKPGTAVLALRSARLPAAAWLVRLLGAVEVVVGTAAITVGGVAPAALVAGSYAGFAAFVAVALARGGVISSCGCFGKPDTPPTRLHMVMNLSAAAVAGAVAVEPLGGVGSVLADQPLAGVPFLALTTVCVWLAYLALTALPTLRPPATR
jgi:hypothetical protein